MVQPGIGLDTPRTTLGDATYLASQNLDFDISQEQSFQSPSKDNNLITQLQNARRGAVNLKTPRSRAVLGDRRNLPVGLGGGEFTPLLKSATRNSARRNGKENETPAYNKHKGLQDIPEDFSPLPQLGSSVYGRDSGNGSYMSVTPMPHIESSSTASTPMALLPRRTEGPGALQDGNQLSLREQENVIDKIEKENFGLKLKIHFLEEALRKAGPGFSEAALKENTELKVDKVTMQKELHRYRKTLAAAEKDVELFRQHMLEMQEKFRRKQFDAGQLEELERLRHDLEQKEVEVNRLKGQESRYDDLEDKIHDLEADLREKDRLLDDQDDEVEKLKDKLERQAETIRELEEASEMAQRRAIELEAESKSSEELVEAKEMIEELERDLERLKHVAEDAKEECEEAVKEKQRAQSDLEDAREERQVALEEKERAQADLDELQDEMANKSITTKGLSRQIEEKANRLQDELEALREKYKSLEEEHAGKIREVKKLQEKIEDMEQDAEVREQKLKDKFDITENDKKVAVRERADLSRKLDALQKDLQQREDEKNLLQVRHDALTSESAGLQRDLSRCLATIEDLEEKLDYEKTSALTNERDVRDQYKTEIDRLTEEIEDLQAELREKERLHDQEADKWSSQQRILASQRDDADEKAAGLQRTIDKLQEAEGSLSSKETKLKQALQSEEQRHAGQEAILSRQINELNDDIQACNTALDKARADLSNVREELRLSQREQKSLVEKIEALEDEVEILQTSLDDETDRSNQEISAVNKEADSLRTQIQALSQDLLKSESDVADARAEIKALEGDFRAGEGSYDELHSKLRDVEGKLTQTREEKQNAKVQLAAITLELNSLRRTKADIEAERDELHSQLQAMKHQEEETFRLDQERVDLRTAKLKLENEICRLREEAKAAVSASRTLEKELEEELERASVQETRLNTEVQDLQRILRGSSEKKELAAARKMIQQLEARVRELESQTTALDDPTDAFHELSILRRDLSTARHKEMEYLQREASQKEALRGLKRQVIDLERKAHDAELSRIAAASPSPSPRSSAGGSARKTELIEIRGQLSTAHENLKGLRSQLKDVEKEAARKVKAANFDLREKSEAWEAEKDQFERLLDEALSKRDELISQNKTSEASITRLRGKVDRLEKALQAERLNHGEDRTIANERHDLHEMLRETQVQVETLQVVIKERESTIKTINKSYARLNDYAGKVQDQRNALRAREASSNEQLDRLERKLKETTQDWEADKQSFVLRTHRSDEDLAAKEQVATLERKLREATLAWEAEKRALTRGVRFPNMSMSSNGDEIEALRQEAAEREHFHVKCQRGLQMQIDWWRAKCDREAMFRDMGAYAKKYMRLQIEMFEACNKADLALLRSIPGLKSVHRVKSKPKMTLRKVGHMVRAIVRMKMGAKEWADKLVLKQTLLNKIEEQNQQKQIEDARTKAEATMAAILLESGIEVRDRGEVSRSNVEAGNIMRKAEKRRSSGRDDNWTKLSNGTQAALARSASARKASSVLRKSSAALAASMSSPVNGTNA